MTSGTLEIYYCDVDDIGQVEIAVHSSVKQDLKEFMYASFESYSINDNLFDFKEEVVGFFLEPISIQKLILMNGEDKISEDAYFSFVNSLYNELSKRLDFLKLDDKGNVVNEISEDEVNIFYVTDVSSIEDGIIEIIKGKELRAKETPVTVKKKKEKAVVEPPQLNLPKVEKSLRGIVKGQDHVIDKIIEVLKLSVVGLKNNPVLMFAGPTGTGKTLLAETLGKNYSNKFKKINCAEYGREHEVTKLIGSPPGYMSSDKKGVLESLSAKGNDWVILFDELEKADNALFEMLLSLFDTGKIQNNKGVELDFTNTIFICTSNLGYKYTEAKVSMGFDKTDMTEKVTTDNVISTVKSYFAPEFINRFDGLMTFNPLSRKTITEIIKLELKKLPVKYSKKLIDFLLEKAYSEEYGAREVNRAINKYLHLPLADILIESKGRFEPNMSKVFKANISGNTITFTK